MSASAAALSVGLLATTPALAGAESARPGSPDWAAVDAPIPPGIGSIGGLEVFNARDAWSVGGEGSFDQGDRKPVAMHWNGKSWTRVATPGTTGLHAVSGTSGRDVWAVGGDSEGTKNTVLHWDGTKWSEVPNVVGTPEHPRSVADIEAVAPNDVWMSGSRHAAEFTDFRGVMQHWDGKVWRDSVLPEPHGLPLLDVFALTSFGPANVWATGIGFGGDDFVPYFLRWNGKKWSLVDVPGTIKGGYSDIQMLGPDRFVATGFSFTAADPTPRPVVASYNRGVWTQEVLPESVTRGELNGVSLDGSGGLWVVGDLKDPDSDHDGRPLILRRQGSTWSVVPSPVTELGHLSEVAVVPGTTKTWATGTFGVTNDTQRGFILGRGIGSR